MAVSLDHCLRRPGPAQALRRDYLNAKPWPHIVLEGIFPEELLDAVAAECAGLDQARLVMSNDDRQIKQEAWDGLGPATTRFLDLVEGESFRDFISTVTGVADLLTDPTHTYAGAHRTPPGGFTKIHRDFEVHPISGLFHRVNLLVYLNRDWADSYGGSLELWPPDMSAMGRRIFPRYNTMILWETHGATLHGLPDPVNCPSDRMRLSVACYYYTKAPRVAGSGRAARSLLGSPSRRGSRNRAHQLAGSLARTDARATAKSDANDARQDYPKTHFIVFISIAPLRMHPLVRRDCARLG